MSRTAADNYINNKQSTQSRNAHTPAALMYHRACPPASPSSSPSHASKNTTKYAYLGSWLTMSLQVGSKFKRQFVSVVRFFSKLVPGVWVTGGCKIVRKLAICMPKAFQWLIGTECRFDNQLCNICLLSGSEIHYQTNV